MNARSTRQAQSVKIVQMHASVTLMEWFGETRVVLARKKLDPFAAPAIFIVSKNYGYTILALFSSIMEKMTGEKVDRETQLLYAISAICDSSMKQFSNIIDTSERLG